MQTKWWNASANSSREPSFCFLSPIILVFWACARICDLHLFSPEYQIFKWQQRPRVSPSFSFFVCIRSTWCCLWAVWGCTGSRRLWSWCWRVVCLFARLDISLDIPFDCRNHRFAEIEKLKIHLLSRSWASRILRFSWRSRQTVWDFWRPSFCTRTK